MGVNLMNIKLDKKIKDELVLRITKNFKVKEIILFGSFANGKPHEYSDVDLVIVLDEKGFAKNYMEKINQRLRVSYILADIEKKIPIDILVYTIDEWEKLININSSFMREINENGVKLI